MLWALTIVDRHRPPDVRAAELAYLPRGDYLKVVVLGYRRFAADLIWLKAVQHFGESKQTARGYQWAYHATDVVTDLDPQFAVAYQAAGTILGVWADRVEESIAILIKGMRQLPDVWQLPFYVGYDYYYVLHDGSKAAHYFRMASILPGAPAYLPKLAARMTVENGDPDAAIEFLERLYQQTQDERLREGLLARMKEVVVERDLRFLEGAVARYRARHGRMPEQLADLVNGGVIDGVPDEPLGGRYELSAGDGSVRSTSRHERLKVYRH
jgi:hypothetical protein